MAIYLDHNAGAPLRPEAAEAISRFIAERVGNPSSVNRAGQRARRMLEVARLQVAAIVGAEAGQIVFTSGGTESNNLAIFGAVTAATRRRRIISSEIEHSSILAPLLELERRGFEVVRVAPDSDGQIDRERVLEAIGSNSDTALVTLGLANSEVGTIQDLASLSAACREAGAIFHIDAAHSFARGDSRTQAQRSAYQANSKYAESDISECIRGEHVDRARSRERGSLDGLGVRSRRGRTVARAARDGPQPRRRAQLASNQSRMEY